MSSGMAKEMGEVTRIETEASKALKVSSEPEKLGRFILAIFQTIAVTFQPASYGSTLTVLIAKAKEIAARIATKEQVGGVDNAVPNPSRELTSAQSIVVFRCCAC